MTAAESTAITTKTPADLDYERAKVHPIAKIILDALHQQDVDTYSDSGGNMGRLALDTADRAIEAILALLRTKFDV